MGTRVENYCDSCGEVMGDRFGTDYIQISAQGTSTLPILVQICTKTEPMPAFEVDNNLNRAPKIKGCARKFLSKAMLAKLYAEVEEIATMIPDGYDKQPFQL